MPGDFYTMPGVLYNAGDFYTMPGDFYTMAGVLYNARKIFKSTFCSHLGPLSAIGARFFRRSRYIGHPEA